VEVPPEKQEKHTPGEEKTDKGRTYEIRWCTEKPLSEELKLGFVMGDQAFYFSLQRERNEDVILSEVTLEEGVHTITLHTAGDALRRPELKHTDITLKFV
jgi:alpha-L-fucosidase